MKISFTVVILDYFKAAHILKNVASLLEQKVSVSYNIIVVDNSCDEKNAQTLSQLKKYKNLQLIINNENSGYSKAHNDIQFFIKGEYVLIVNPDIHWGKSGYTLQKMLDFMKQNPQTAIMGPKQKLENGSVEMTVRPFPSFFIQISRRTRLRRIPGLSDMVKKDEAEARGLFRSKEVDWLQSSCILVRKKFWDEVGGFDENYKIFMADVELCFQAWKRGYKVMYYPEVSVCADGKRSSSGSFRNFFNNWILRQHFKDACKYHWNHLFERGPRV